MALAREWTMARAPSAVGVGGTPLGVGGALPPKSATGAGASRLRGVACLLCRRCADARSASSLAYPSAVERRTYLRRAPLGMQVYGA